MRKGRSSRTPPVLIKGPFQKEEQERPSKNRTHDHIGVGHEALPLFPQYIFLKFLQNETAPGAYAQGDGGVRGERAGVRENE
jgi:hypothetical protein